MILRAQLFALVLGLFSTHAASFLFDAEEIKSLNYAVEILDQPVLITDELDPLTVRMLNKHGQPYACRLPEPAPPPGERSERPEEAADPSALLAPMALGPCLQRTRDWWTYELCPRAGIRQFHIEGGQIVGEVSSLGRFESDYDWGQDDGRSRNAKQRYHSQQYTNGSDCDLTGRPRSSEVRYVCEEGGEDALVRVDEPETCRYLLTVRTARVCRHRLLAPPVQQRPQPLTCRPQLSAHQLQLLTEAQQRRRSSDWTAAQAAEEAQAEAEAETGEGETDELSQLQEDSAADDTVGGDTGGDEKTAAQMELSAGTSEDNVEEVVKGLFSGISEAMIDEKLEDSHPLRVLRRWLGQQEGATDATQLKHTQELFEAMETQTQKMAKVLDDVLAGFRAISTDMRADSSHLIALSRRHTAARRIQSARAARIRELLGAGDQGAYPTQIVRELLMYIHTLNVFSEVTLALTEETGRLQQLVREHPDRLGFHAIETVLGSMSKLLRFSQHVRLFYAQTKAVRTALLAMSDSPEEEEEEDWEAAGAGLASEDAESASPGAGERSGANDDDDAGAAASEQEDLTSGEATARETGRKKGKRQLKFSTLEALGLDKMVQVSSIDRLQRNRIETAVRQKLSKIGLDPSGPEIKMRLLKYPDSSGVEKEHTLSDFEMAAFEKALITIMVGGQQALMEHDRQQRLERNYDYNFAETLRSLETTEPEEEPETKPPDALFTLV